MVFCDSVSSHCTRVSRSVRCPRSFRADSAGSFTDSKDDFESWESTPEWRLCPSLFEPFRRHAQGYLPRLVRASKARACLAWIPAGTGPSSSPDLQLLDFGRTSLPPLPCQDTGELNFVGWYKSLAGSSVVLSAAWHDFQARAAGTLLAVEFPAVRPAGTRHAFEFV